MTRAFLLLLSAAPLLAGAAPPAQTDLQGSLDALVSSERAFSKTSLEKGTKEAFLAFLADDSVLFRPGPVAGRPFTEKNPSPPGVLTWSPIKADVARSGDLGYTTGPWEARRNATDETPVVQGNYVTVWKKQADGAWKVMTDIGTMNPKPAAPPAEALRLDAAEVQARGSAKDPKAAEAALLAADRAFSKASQSKGALAAYLDTVADDTRVFRNAADPALGKDAVRTLLADQKGTMTWEPDHALLSQAGDLGVTYGTYDQSAEGKSEKGSYLRIWKQQSGGAWKVVLDITSPPPPPPPPAAPPH